MEARQPQGRGQQLLALAVHHPSHSDCRQNNRGAVSADPRGGRNPQLQIPTGKADGLQNSSRREALLEPGTRKHLLHFQEYLPALFPADPPNALLDSPGAQLLGTGLVLGQMSLLHIM